MSVAPNATKTRPLSKKRALSRWAELVSQLTELTSAVSAAGDDGVLTAEQRMSVQSALELARTDLIDALPG